MKRSQTLSNDLAHVRSLLEEEQEKTRVLKRTVGNHNHRHFLFLFVVLVEIFFFPDEAETRRREELIVHLEMVISGQKQEISVLQSRLSVLEAEAATAASARALDHDGESELSEATSNVFSEQIKMLQTKLTHERSWRQGLEVELKALQRGALSLHDVIVRQARVIEKAEVRLNADERSKVRVTTLRREKAKVLKEARKAHGASASHLLMLGDIISFAGTMDVLGEDKGTSLANLSAALDAYVRANQTANKKLRKRFGQLKQDAQLQLSDAIQDRAEGASLQLTDAQGKALSDALADYVSRQQLEVRADARDKRLFERLDKILSSDLSSKACRKILSDAVERYCSTVGTNSMTSFELLDSATNAYCSDKYGQ